MKDTSDKLKQASEIDHHVDANVSLKFHFYYLFQLHVQINQFDGIICSIRRMHDFLKVSLETDLQFSGK